MTFEIGLGLLIWVSVFGMFFPRLAWAGTFIFATIYLAEKNGWF